jgi:hypothetical protein
MKPQEARIKVLDCREASPTPRGTIDCGCVSWQDAAEVITQGVTGDRMGDWNSSMGCCAQDS